MDVILAILGFLVLCFGFLSLSSATLGVGLIGVALFFGVLARMVQAGRHSANLATAIRERAVVPPQAPAAKE